MFDTMGNVKESEKMVWLESGNHFPGGNCEGVLWNSAVGILMMLQQQLQTFGEGEEEDWAAYL